MLCPGQAHAPKLHNNDTQVTTMDDDGDTGGETGTTPPKPPTPPPGPGQP